MALSVSDLSNSGHVPTTLPVEGSSRPDQCSAKALMKRALTVDLKGLPRFGWDPFPVHVSYILLEKGRVFQLAENVSQ